MLYCVANASYPMEYISSGNLVSHDGFLHERRNLDSYVFIIVRKGTLHIEQHGERFDVHENEAILLFAHQTHFGYKPSEGQLSYYWVHFYIRDPNYSVYSRNTLLRYNPYLDEELLYPPLPPRHDNFLIPEYGKLSLEKRSLLLFVQLLDVAKRDNYQPTWRCHYALNLMLMEYSDESFSYTGLVEDRIPPRVRDMLEWIRSHYDEQISVTALAKQYNYHPTYLSSLVKQYTGFSISSYVTHIRISVAKNLLCNRNNTSIQEIAYLCGFNDEKYFMRTFKAMEGMTPSQYRNAFHQRKINTK